ncbi:cis-prenyltransferase [Coemansia sp. Benny D115]|nr:cis-prenyltransferase [Coemansia sp. Benny D115]
MHTVDKAWSITLYPGAPTGTVTSGHVAGFHKLANVLEWCAELGIRHVSVFAFAINNFNRSEEEVSALMNLAKDKLKVLSERSDLVLRYNGRIRVVGNRALLSADVLEAIEQAEEKTRENKGITLNVCFPYSSTFEISEAVRSVVKDVENGRLEVSQIDEKALESRLQIPGPDLDILVRTSGQIRFSNYMLWQSSKMAYIQFVDAYWPDFSLMHMLRIILSWQQSSWIISLRKKNMDSHRAPQQTPHTLVSDDGTCCSEQDATQ